ncbi:MFS transporter [Knoellia aerolata]|uniref:MFS transporter n=1 Tax=Knoellia aerolata DSM 18566 TaxID=1385519 RepID=A0A0A0K0X1_9MICO|nr:MFS transporter [Knoellia aerolata]KGN43073.1 MFS transporter [Knoellia aerolata DSM 18566]
MSTHLSPSAARRVFLVLTATRWLPVGFVIGVFTLFALERGLTVQETMTYGAAQGVMVLLLELPTSGFADAFGRKAVLVAAGVVNVIAGVLYLTATTFWQFALAAGFLGIYRALDSGPLEAWFVDTVHLTEPGADVDQALAAQGTIVGVAIAGGSLASGGLILWHPFADYSAIAFPIVVSIAFAVVHLVLTLTMVHEPHESSETTRARQALDSARDTPKVIGDGLTLLRHNRILAGLIGVELFWVIGMMVFETMLPIRLSEMLGTTDAGVLLGPVAAGGWAVFAFGSAVAGRMMRRWGVVRAAIAARVLNGLGAAVMGLMLGPAGLVGAYLVTYMLHGVGGAPHLTLLHREASARNRATVLSMNSMVMQAGGAVAAPTIGWLAATTSVQTAMVAAGLVSVLGAFLYLPALRQERALKGGAHPAPVT